MFSSVCASEFVEDSWSTKTSMSQVRGNLGVVCVDGKIYAIGGSTKNVGDGGTVEYVVGTNERYDPKTDSWVTLKPMPTPRMGFTIAAYSDKIYCIGGFNTTGEGWGNSVSSCSVVEVYDTVLDKWSTKASYPFKGAGMCASVVDGQIFMVYGGDLFMYDIAVDVWFQKDSMPGRAPSYLNSVVVDNRILFLDAIQFDDGPSKIMIYDPKTDEWIKGQGESCDSNLGSGAVVTTGNYAPQKIYVIIADTLEVYDPVSNDWSTVSVMPTLRSSFGMAVVDDVLYVIGGYISVDMHDFFDWYAPKAVTALNESYVPIGYSSMAITSKFELTNTLSTYLVVVVLVLIVGIVSGLFFYFKKNVG